MTDRKGAPCVISAAEHAGWAHLVCVAAHGHEPTVVERRRVTLIEPELPRQPYEHDSVGLKEDDADALIARVRQSVARRAGLALKRVVGELAPAYGVIALAIRQPTLTELPESIAAVRASYRLQCTADGLMYQLALCRAARDLDLEVHLCRRGDETTRAAERLGVSTEDIASFVGGAGRPPGPPWAQEHQRAYAAGIAALAGHTRAKLKIPRA